MAKLHKRQVGLKFVINTIIIDLHRKGSCPVCKSKRGESFFPGRSQRRCIFSSLLVFPPRKALSEKSVPQGDVSRLPPGITI